MHIAILDKDGYLVGSKEVKKPKKDDVECGDLPVDGSYWYVNGTFSPRGFGKGKPGKPPVDRDRAVYEALSALIEGREIPQESIGWCAWYKETFL